MVYFRAHTDNDGVIMVNDGELCTYGYDSSQRLFTCMVKSTDYVKGFKMYYAKNPLGLAKQITEAINNKKLNLENLTL